MVATQQPDFAAALCAQSMFPVNIALAYLSENKAVPEAFVSDLTAGVSNCDSGVPIDWDRACDDREDQLPLDYSGMRYVEQEEEAPKQEQEEGDTQKRPPAWGSSSGGGGGAHQLRQNNQTPVPMALPHRPTPTPQQKTKKFNRRGT